MDYEQQIREALARGYCSPENAFKEVDSDLIESMVQEILKNVGFIPNNCLVKQSELTYTENDFWSLSNNCKDKFKIGDLVRSRGGMGNYKLIIWDIKNNFYCECRERGLFGIFKKKRYFNMNCLEKE